MESHSQLVMPSRLSAIFRSVLKVFSCTRKTKEAHNLTRKTNETDELDGIPKPLFPCYKLPLDVQEHIVRFLDTSEIMQCSIVSPTFRVAARLAKPKLVFLSITQERNWNYFIEDDESLRVLGKPAPTIELKTNDKSNYFIDFFWREQKDQLDVILEGRELTKISEDLWMAVVGCNIVIYNSSAIHSELADYQFIFDIIFQVFTVDCFNLGGETRNKCVFPEKHKFPLALRYRNSAQYLRLMQSRKSTRCAALNSDELSALLDNLTVPRIKMLWKVEPGAKFTGTLKTKKINLYRANWLTLDNILTMECEVFTGIGALWTAPELISIVRKWQEGGFEKLKRLKLGLFYWNRLTILDKVEGTVVSASEKEIRRSDGKKAVVLVNNLQFLLNVLDEN